MLISVILPVYNVENYLRKCLESLLSQTYKDLEIIMIDDGSTDSSGVICDEYAQKYQHCNVIHKENNGLGMARNTGLEVAKGEYVYFLDSDDYIDPNEIELLYYCVKNNNVDVCLTGFKAVSDNGNILFEKKYKDEVFPGAKAKNILLPRMLGSSPQIHDGIEMGVSAQIYSMKPIREHNIRFVSESELISEDLVFNIDYMQYANGACTSSNTGNYYRQNPNSLSHSYLPHRFEKSKKFYLNISDRLITLGYERQVLLRLERTFFIYIRIAISQEAGKHSPYDNAKKEKIIKEICCDETVQKVIKNYPIKYLNMKQKFFLFLVRYRCAFLLNILLK